MIMIAYDHHSQNNNDNLDYDHDSLAYDHDFGRAKHSLQNQSKVSEWMIFISVLVMFYIK